MLAVVLLGAVVIAFCVFEYWAIRHWTRRLPRPDEGWLWERSWRRQVLGWGGMLVGLGLVAALIVKFPPGSAAAPYLRGGLVLFLVAEALILKRRDRRKGIEAAVPFMEHGPPGWEWDPERVTWRPPG